MQDAPSDNAAAEATPNVVRKKIYKGSTTISHKN